MDETIAVTTEEFDERYVIYTDDMKKAFLFREDGWMLCYNQAEDGDYEYYMKSYLPQGRSVIDQLRLEDRERITLTDIIATIRMKLEKQ